MKKMKVPLILWAITAALCIWVMAIQDGHAATTHYVSVAGGNASQCTGASDVAYPGTGTAQNCAWGNLQCALPPGYTGDGAPAPRIAAGDTVQIDPGSYQMGYGTLCAEGCSTSYTYACVLDLRDGIKIPDNVTITGMPGGTCTNKPLLWGSGHQSNLIDVTGTSGVTIACLDLSDHSLCIDLGNYTHGVVPICPNTYPGADGASDGIEADNTIASGLHTNNLTLKYLNIHGFAHDGFHVGGLTGTTTSDHVEICCNASAGWDGDIGHDGSSNNIGTILIKNFGIDWNGCVENYPLSTTMPYVVCIANGQGQGGYGDGLGTYQTCGNWRLINGHALHNTSDGLDLLYLRGTGCSSFFDHVTSEFNASQQIKAAGNSTIQNSVINGYCSGFQTLGLQDDERCRAFGNAVEIDPYDFNQTMTVQNNTITGNGDCLIVSADPGVFTPDATDVVNITSNILLGQVSYLPKNSGGFVCGFFTVIGVETVNWSGPDLMINVRNTPCVTGISCVDPKLKNETLSSFDATPLSGSPALSGTTLCTPNDWAAQTRGNPCTIGAIETTTTPQQPTYTGN